MTSRRLPLNEKDLTLGASDNWAPEEIIVSINGLPVYRTPINTKLTHNRRFWTAPDYPRRL